MPTTRRVDEYTERVPLRREIADNLGKYPTLEGKLVNPLWAPEHKQLEYMRRWQKFNRENPTIPKPRWTRDPKLLELARKLGLLEKAGGEAREATAAGREDDFEEFV